MCTYKVNEVKIYENTYKNNKKTWKVGKKL